MFACPLFSAFRELNKTVKLNGTNIDTIIPLIGVECCVGIVWFEFAKRRDAKIILHAKMPTFKAAKVKRMDVVQGNQNWLLFLGLCL